MSDINPFLAALKPREKSFAPSDLDPPIGPFEVVTLAERLAGQRGVPELVLSRIELITGWLIPAYLTELGIEDEINLVIRIGDELLRLQNVARWLERDQPA